MLNLQVHNTKPIILFNLKVVFVIQIGEKQEIDKWKQKHFFSNNNSLECEPYNLKVLYSIWLILINKEVLKP